MPMPLNCAPEVQDCVKQLQATSESTSDSWQASESSSRMAPICTAEAHDGAKRSHTASEADKWSASKMMNDNGIYWDRTLIDVLPEAMLMEILSRVPDARELVKCAMVNNSFRSSFTQVNKVQFLCKLVDIRNQKYSVPFKETVTATLKQLTSVETLRLEIEDEMPASRLKDDKIERKSLWLSEAPFIEKWLPKVEATLQNLTVIDYGQQAIFHASPLLQLLSTQCKQLRTLELRNMYLNCKDCKRMNDVTSLTLRCVKLTDTGLADLNACMPRLDTLTLVTVVGLKEAEFKSDHLKVLCLGLATKVKWVKLTVSRLVKLQLKMACPDKLIVNAPDLKCLAVCMDKRDNTVVQFENVGLLKELLMGASEFETLTKLSACNPHLEKVFLDVPCMAFEDSGGWKGVLKTVPLAIPNMDAIRTCCPNLQTLSVGPGLWYALEEKSSKNGDIVLKWPALKRLIVHLIVQFKDTGMTTSMGLLTALVKAVPTLTTLEVYVHKDSNVEVQEIFRLMNHQFPQLEMKCDSWKKGLRFECFSF